MTEDAPKGPTRCGFAALIGEPNAGKSTRGVWWIVPGQALVTTLPAALARVEQLKIVNHQL
jgi:hypothetical protein